MSLLISEKANKLPYTTNVLRLIPIKDKTESVCWKEEGRIINMSQNPLLRLTTKNLWLYLQYEFAVTSILKCTTIAFQNQINTVYTLIDQARTLMVKQAPGAVPQQVLATSKK